MSRKRQLVTVKRLHPPVSETTSVLLSAVTCSWPLQPSVCVCVCLYVKGRLKDRESCHYTAVLSRVVSPEVRGHSGFKSTKTNPGQVAPICKQNSSQWGYICCIWMEPGWPAFPLHSCLHPQTACYCLLVVVPGIVSAGCKHPVIMASVTFRLCSMELSPLTVTLFPNATFSIWRALFSNECSFKGR